MQRDPFYRQIIAGLEAGPEPDLFEDCASDLLRSDYPTLVPVRGGSDSGMDGAIADGEGEPFPLVTTTGKDVIGNLTRNLKKYVEDGGKRRKAVLATSQRLTPRRHMKLRSRASEWGFTLIQTYDQDAFANLLYRNPQWCRDLLGLTGNPPALSILPKTARLLLTIPMIGREEDLTWLCNTEGDRLVVGQPGSGKTFLLYNLAKTGAALFAVTTDIGLIAQSYRAEQPDIIIVDDAHLPQHQELVQNLRHLREETGAAFSIVASCWPGQQPVVAELLNLPTSQVHTLELLGRDEILRIVQAAGISGEQAPFYQPLNQLIKEIIDQAEGRPGLAVALTHLFLQGDWRRIVSGDVPQSVLRVLLPSGDRVTKQVMAAFAVGGEAGMPMEMVADTLSITPIMIQNIIVELEAGGIVTDVAGNIAVRPAALRFALIREVFCGGTAFDLPERILDALIRQAPYLPDVARTLIIAAGRGAVVSPRLLMNLLDQISALGGGLRPTLRGYLWEESPSDVWRMYAWLGSNETQWILGIHPEKLTEIARPAMENAPEVAIPMLFQSAIDDNRTLHAHPDHPMRQIQDWVVAVRPGTPEALKRRGALFSVVEDWIRSGNDILIGLKGLHYAFSPRFDIATWDPGSGNTLHLGHGLLAPEEIQVLHSKWPTARKLLEQADLQNWQSLRELAEEWAYPGRLNIGVPDEIRQVMREFAVELLADILAIAANRPGVLHWAREVANNIQADIDIPLDPDFDVLYPARRRGEDWRDAEQHEIKRARELAERWSKLEPAIVVPQMVSMAQEAQLSGTTWPEYLTFVCREVAEKTECALEWLSIMVDSPLEANLLHPFFVQAVRRNEAGWIELAYLMLEMPLRRTIVIPEILKMPDAPPDKLGHIMEFLEGMGQHVEFLCFRNEIPESTLLMLYQHSDPSIAGTAAAASWHADPKGAIPATLYTAWRTAIINWNGDDYHLGEVLKSDSQIAEDWISARLTEAEFHVYYPGKLHDLVALLDRDARLRLLEQIPDRYGLDGLVSELIDRQPELYQTLLNMNRLEQYHLAPLEGIPDDSWAELAKLAVAAGYERGRVVAATLGYGPSWSGKESEMWMTRIANWERLCSHHDPEIRAVAQEGKAYAEARYERAREQEKIEAIYGRM
jgi:hypothetical protein